MIFLFAIIFWLILNYIFWWFWFNSILCFLVWLFLIMPILLKINTKEIKYIFSNKKIIYINLFLNFVISPIIAFLAWYFSFWIENYHFIIALILLSIIPWWWLLMNWLEQSKANLHIWFVLFAFNLFVFSIFYVLFNFWVEAFIDFMKNQNNIFNLQLANSWLSLWWNIPANCGVEKIWEKIWLVAPSCFEWKSTILYGFYWFFALIFIPFIVSRIILFFYNKKDKIIYLAWKTSKISAFILIAYIFSLEYIRKIFLIDYSFILKIFLGVVLYYILFYFALVIILKKVSLKIDEKKAIFWNSYTRFITLSLILSFLYAIAWEKPEIILVSILAYFVQIFSTSIIIRLKNIE